MSIRILITDDHGVIRAGKRALLAGIPEIEVVGEASDGPEVLSDEYSCLKTQETGRRCQSLVFSIFNLLQPLSPA